MSDLILKYKSLYSTQRGFDKLFGCGAGNFGKMYSYTNTNYRTTKSFYRNFETFKEIIGVPRPEWPASNHGQEKHKQHVVNMRASKLFESRNDIFTLTTKGKLYDNFLSISDFNNDEKWIINYLFLLDSYLESTSNYIFEWSEKLLKNLSVVFTKEEIMITLEDFISVNKRDTEAVFFSEFFIVHSFYSNIEFLETYKLSNEEERNELKTFIYNNKITGNYNDPISKKYMGGGNFNSSMLEDEAKVFFITSKIMNLEGSFIQFTNRLLEIYSNLYAIDINKLYDHINHNSDVFEVIYLNVYNLDIESQDEDEQLDVPKEDILDDVPEDKIDDTTREGKRALDKIFQQRKVIAREQANYTCELHSLNNCKHFTSKATRKNYVEVHHLIPKEFRNDFEHSLDVLANYVSLCPHCHRMIHLAVDRERQSLLHHLYNQRKDRLLSVGLQMDIDKLYIYNKITEL